jgi:hypothetical protein
MPSTLTAPSSTTASTQAVQPGQARRPYRPPCGSGCSWAVSLSVACSMLTSNAAGLSQRILDKSSRYVGCMQKAHLIVPSVIVPSVREGYSRERTGYPRSMRLCSTISAWQHRRMWLVPSAPLISSSSGLVYALHHSSCAMSALSPYASALASMRVSASGLTRPRPLPCRMRSCGMRR